MKETRISRAGLSGDDASFLACLATILEVPEPEVPDPSSPGEPSEDWNIVAWLGSVGIGLVPVADPTRFAWPGPWIARVRGRDGRRRSVVMYGRSPSGVVWDPNAGEARAGSLQLPGRNGWSGGQILPGHGAQWQADRHEH